MPEIRKKILIIRFSSFGDIIQNLAIAKGLVEDYDYEVHWLTKSEFAPLLERSPYLERVISYDKRLGIRGLVSLGKNLAESGYECVYDAHSNIRTAILWIVFFFNGHSRWASRSKERVKRFFLFFLGVNFFPHPFVGVYSFTKPLLALGLKVSPKGHKLKFTKEEADKVDQLLGNFLTDPNIVAFAPSAAWEMKRWPVEHWKKLCLLYQGKIVLLGGPKDQFLQEMVAIDPKRILNLAGKLSLAESALVLLKVGLVVSADTGMIHVADLFGTKGIHLFGPTAFGRTYSPSVSLLEVDLECRPCTKDGRGRCSQDVYQKCMVEILPEKVHHTILEKLT